MPSEPFRHAAPSHPVVFAATSQARQHIPILNWSCWERVGMQVYGMLSKMVFLYEGFVL